jgi:purine-binding chemotaxis protein CheW
MRALPVRIFLGAPPFVRGVAVIRGAPTPVVDLGTLLGERLESQREGGRLVVLRLGARQLALRVDAVMGVRLLPAETLTAVAGLLGNVAHDHVEALAALDGDLLTVLRTAAVISDLQWRTLLEEQ